MRHVYFKLVALHCGGNVYRIEQLRHPFARKIGVQDGVDVLHIGIDRARLDRFSANIDGSADDLARSEHMHKLYCALYRLFSVHRFNALCKSRRGIGGMAQFARGVPDIVGKEHGAFKDRDLRILGYLGVQTSHNARNADAL